MRDFLKNYATPLVVAVFLAIATTGLMMFFGVAAHGVQDLHEWIGLTFVAAALLHILWNWRGLTIRLRQTRAVIVIAVLVAAATGMIGYTQFKGGQEREGGGTRQVVNALGKAPIATLAPALGTTADEAIARLKAKGIAVTGPGQSLAEIAKAQHADLPVLFGTIVGAMPGGADAD